MTDENDRSVRPNANYKLSKGDDVNEQLPFRYNRERRLENAPQNVKDLYKEQKPGGFSLFRPLVADKPRAALFITIIVLCIIILVITISGYISSDYILDGNKLDIKATGYEGTAIVVIRKTVSDKNSAYSGSVDIAVSTAVQMYELGPVFYHKIFFSLEPAEEYRFVVPFDAQEILMVLQTEKNSLNITVKVD